MFKEPYERHETPISSLKKCGFRFSRERLPDPEEKMSGHK